jgi:hypothetical protein
VRAGGRVRERGRGPEHVVSQTGAGERDRGERQQWDAAQPGEHGDDEGGEQWSGGHGGAP